MMSTAGVEESSKEIRHYYRFAIAKEAKTEGKCGNSYSC